MLKLIFYLFINNLFSSVWIRPTLFIEDDGFEIWKFNGCGELLNVRFMGEAKRFREYGDMFGVY